MMGKAGFISSTVAPTDAPEEFEEVAVQAQPMARDQATETEAFDPPQEPGLGFRV